MKFVADVARRTRGWLIVLTTLLATLVALPTPSLANQARTLTVNSRHHLDARQLLIPVASTLDRRPYGMPYAVVLRINRAPAKRPGPYGAGTLLAVTPRGDVHRLGKSGVAGYFSIAGRVVIQEPDNGPLLWWEATRHGPRHGSGTLPAGALYLTAAADGWIYTDRDGRLYDQSARGGKAQEIGRPFPHANPEYMKATGGPTGVVVTDREQIVFIDYATRKVTTLDSSWKPSGQSVSCYSVTATLAACGSHHGFFSTRLTNVNVDPLNGQSAKASTGSGHCPHNPVLAGDSAAWRGCGNRLTWLHGRKVSTTSIKLPLQRIDPYPLVASAGSVLPTAHNYARIRTVSRSGAAHTLLKSQRSTAEASSFSFAGGQIVWREDDAGPRPARLKVWRQALAVHAGQPAAVHSRVRVGTSPATGKALRNAGPTVAWSTHKTGHGIYPPAVTLRVQSQFGTRHVPGVDPSRPISISQRRLLYFNAATGLADLLNLHTDTDHEFAATTARLSGSYLASLSDDGTLTLRHLGVMPSDTTVATNLSSSTQVYLGAEAIGWTSRSCGAGDICTSTSQYAPIATPNQLVTLPHGEVIWALTDAGILTQTNLDSSDPPEPLTEGELRDYEHEAFSLRNYQTGREHLVLHGSFLIAGPQISHGIVAWINRFGTLKAIPVRK